MCIRDRRNAAGEKEGYGTIRAADGTVYEGEWKGGLQEGRGTYRYAYGDVYEGEFKADQQEGRGTYRYASGTVEVVFYKAGKDVGEGVRWMGNGQITGRLRDGQPVEVISLEEARATVARLGLPLPEGK